MARRGTPTFIDELPLVVSARDEREMLVRLEMARQLSNACLGEALRRLDLMRESLAYARARAMPKMLGKRPNKERAAVFVAVRHAYGFTSDSISAFGTQCKNKARWNEGRSRTDPRLGAHETQRIAERAYAAAEMYAFGVRGRPRFKGKGRPMHSLEGKSSGSSVCWNPGTGCLDWGALRLRAVFAPDGRDPWLEQSLNARTKFARIVWRIVKGERRWFVQLAQEGLAPLKYETVEGALVGLDVGPSTIAVYSEQSAGLAPLAPEVQQPWAEARRIQRAMDRSRRATNPQCFNADGTCKRGAKVAVRSTAYQALRKDLAETERVLEARRKRSHGALANRILACGNVLQSEKLSYTAFQKSFGRSTKVRAAGSLMALLRRKAERAGGELRDLDTWSLKLSQFDHTTNSCTKRRSPIAGTCSAMGLVWFSATCTLHSWPLSRRERHPLEPGRRGLAGCAIAARPCGVDAPERASTCERGELARHRAGGLRPADAGTGRTAKGLSHRRCFGCCSRKTRAEESRWRRA